MAGRALPRPVEISLAGFGIAGLQVRDIDAAASADCDRPAFCVVNEGDESRDVGIGEVKARHAFLRTAIANHRAILSPTSAATSLERVRSGPFASAGVAAMAESALLEK